MTENRRTEIRRIRRQLRAAWDGSPWYGPSLTEILDDVSALAAADYPVHDAHSIWELVLHMAHWRRVALEVLAGRAISDFGVGLAGDWRRPQATTEEAWREARDELDQTQEELLAALEEVDDERLEETIPGGESSFYVLLHGVVEHDLYHAGQIALLKKAWSEIPY